MTPDEYRLVVARTMDEDTELLPQVQALAETFRWSRRFHDQDARRNPAGFPDLVMIRDHELLVAELKSHRGVVRPAQRLWLAAFAAVAAAAPTVRVYTWRPLDLLNGTIEAELSRVVPTTTSVSQ